MNLLNEYKNKKVQIRKDKTRDLFTVKYYALHSDWSDPLMLSARGLVLNEEGKVILHPYDKFFGLNQLDGILKDPNAEEKEFLYDEKVRSLSYWQDSKIESVTEKIDGSLMTLGYREGYGLIVASSGNTDPNTKICKRMVSYVNKIGLGKKLKDHPEMTLICEFYDPKSKLVYDYGSECKIYLHGARENYNGKLGGDELVDYSRLKEIAKMFDLKIVKTYDFSSVNEIKNFLNNAKHVEGVVVTFKNGIKLKIKSEEYMKLFFGMSIAFNELTKNEYERLVNEYLDGNFDDIYSTLNSIPDVDDRIKKSYVLLDGIKNECDRLMKKIDDEQNEIIRMNNDYEYKKKMLSKILEYDTFEKFMLKNIYHELNEEEKIELVKNFISFNKKKNVKKLRKEIENVG